MCAKRTVIPEHTGVFKLHEQAKATLGNADLRECVQLPWGVGRYEWIAAKTVGLFEELVMLVTVIEGTCTQETCPRMCCGKHVSYQWADEQEPVPRELAAINYMETLVEYGHELLSNSAVLPRDGGPFPKNFEHLMRTLHKRFFRIYAHAYIHHFADFEGRGGEKHLNFCFKHWLFFIREFGLVSDEDMRPLSQLIASFEAQQDRAEQEVAKAGGARPPVTLALPAL